MPPCNSYGAYTPNSCSSRHVCSDRAWPAGDVAGGARLRSHSGRAAFRATPRVSDHGDGPGSAAAGRTVEAALALCRAHRLPVRASRVRVRSLEEVVLETHDAR